jgi:hypothetical protein
MSFNDTVLAYKVMNLLHERKALVYDDNSIAFYLWPRDGRTVVVFDPDEIDLRRVDDVFAHDLSSRLNGRRVVRTNSRGVYLQVGHTVPPAPKDLVSLPLDLKDQPTPTSLPIGITGKGPLWIDLVKADSILLGGSRDMGKSTMIHGWVQALLHGGQVDVYAWDGKGGSEFGRYADRPNFRMINLQASLRELLQEANRRRELLRKSGWANAREYSEHAEPMRPIALVIDEAALVPENARPILKEIVERCRDTGIHPIYGTNNPQQSSLVVKSNLLTRLSLAVPHLSASTMVLNCSGAQNLLRTPGRGLIDWDAQLVEFQAFRIERPMPTEAAFQSLEAMNVVADDTDVDGDVDADRIVELSGEGLSMSAIVRKLWGVTGGSAFLKRVEQVKAVLA